MRVPRVFVVLASIATALIVLPVISLILRSPWHRVGAVATSEAVATALRVSLVCSLGATLLSAIFGLPLAFILGRCQFRGRSVLRALTLLPVVLPPVVGGIALLLAFGRNGVLGARLDSWFGVRLPFTTLGAIIAETFVAMPFFVLAAEGAFAGSNVAIEDAAATLGASPWSRLRTVTIPSIAPALGGALVLCWARALGEFGATVTFAGNSPGRTQTIPLAVYAAFETDPDAATVLSILLVMISLVVLISMRSRLFHSRATLGSPPR